MAEQRAITLPCLLASEIWACKLLAEHHAYLTRPMMWRGSSVLRCLGYPASGSLKLEEYLQVFNGFATAAIVLYPRVLHALTNYSSLI